MGPVSSALQCCNPTWFSLCGTCLIFTPAPAVLKADLIGFHTYDYARHFVSACTRILGLEGTPSGGQRTVCLLASCGSAGQLVFGCSLQPHPGREPYRQPPTGYQPSPFFPRLRIHSSQRFLLCQLAGV